MNDYDVIVMHERAMLAGEAVRPITGASVREDYRARRLQA